MSIIDSSALAGEVHDAGSAAAAVGGGQLTNAVSDGVTAGSVVGDGNASSIKHRAARRPQLPELRNLDTPYSSHMQI